MATTDFIAAIELSSSKICGIAGKKNNDGSIQVLAYAREEASLFIHKGTVYNVDKTAHALSSIINKLENQLKNSIAKVYVGIGGQSLRTVKNTVSRTVGEENLISQELIDSMCDENRSIPLVDMNVLDVAPQEYKIDNNLQADPVGISGQQVTGQYLNIIARATLKKNLEHSFEQAKIEIADDPIIAPVALAKAVLSENEMRSGCALIDFGADTTTIIVYKNNILRYLNVIPLGGNNITRDIASLQIEEEEAEKLKLQYADTAFEEEESETPALCALDDTRTIELSAFNNIIEARTEEIVANVWNQLQLSGYDDKLFAGIMFTGGASNLKNLEKAFRKQSKIEKIKTLKFVHFAVHGLADVMKKDGMQNTLLGLLAAGKENCCLLEIAKPLHAAATQPVQSDMFRNDIELKQQEEAARIARAQREKEERIQKEKERKEKEQREKDERKKRKSNGQGWFEKTFNKLSNEIFSDEDMK